jgi:ribosomal protein S17E
MEKYLEYSTEVINQLKEKYKTCDFHFHLDDINVKVSVFFVLTNSSSLRESESWKKISEEIALKYQTKLETVYEKWNLYIIYVTNDIAPKELKNQIENDKFSSRKIVEDFYNGVFDNDEANRLIIKHITNSDLKEIVDKTQEVTISEFVPKNKSIWELLEKDEKVIGDREAQKKIIKNIAKL